jgi:hypothetical protein
MKEQASGNAPIRLVNVLKHLDIGFGEASAPTFSNGIAPENINRVVALPRRAGCAIAGMALPNLDRTGKSGVLGTIRIHN